MLAIGETYPTSQDIKRIKVEDFHEKLLLNVTTGITDFRESNGKIIKIPRDPLVPIPQTISDISADLLMGEFPKIILPEARQESFDDWAFDNSLEIKMLEAATYVSAVGTIFGAMIKVDNQILFDLKPGNKVVWKEKYGKFENVKFNLSTKQSMNGANYIYEVQEWSLQNGRLVIEHYEVTCRMSDNQIVSLKELSEPEIPGLDFIPVAKWLNVGIMGQGFGRSEYSGNTQLFSEIDNRLDQNNDTIQENQEPWKAVPAGVLDENGQLNRANFSAKMFEKTLGGQADNTVDVVTWDANMPASFQQIETMVDMAFFTSRLSNSLTGREKGGVSESGRALKWKSVSTIAMKQRKEKYAASFIRNFVNFWSRLEGKEIPRKEIIIQWQDGLPIDEQEKTETIVAQVNAGLMSKETAIQKLQEIDTREAQAEITRIQADETFASENEAKAINPVVI